MAASRRTCLAVERESCDTADEFEERFMQPEIMSQLYLAALRWAHILAAVVAVGGTVFCPFRTAPGDAAA